MKAQGIVEYALILVLVAVVIIVIIQLLFNPVRHAPNEFCRTDTINKVRTETCITPAYPMPTKRSSK